MEVRIGVQHTTKEIVFESELTAAALTAQVTAAYEAEQRTITFTDTKQRSYILPLANIGYLECGEAPARKAGFIN